jgi:hypothetical protein
MIHEPGDQGADGVVVAAGGVAVPVTRSGEGRLAGGQQGEGSQGLGQHTGCGQHVGCGQHPESKIDPPQHDWAQPVASPANAATTMANSRRMRPSRPVRGTE